MTITAPLRWIAYQVRLLQQNGLFARIKALVKKIVRPFFRRGIAFVNSRPRLRSWLVRWIRAFGLYGILQSIYFRFLRSNILHNNQSSYAVPYKLQDLTPHARHIYSDLKYAIAKQQRKNN